MNKYSYCDFSNNLIRNKFNIDFNNTTNLF